MRKVLYFIFFLLFLPTMSWAQEHSKLYLAVSQRPNVRVFDEYQNRVLYGVRKQYSPEVMDLVDTGLEYALYEESAKSGTRLIAPEVQRAKYDNQGNLYTVEKFTLIYRSVDGKKRILHDKIFDFVLDDSHGQMLISHYINPIQRTYELTDLQAKPLATNKRAKRKSDMVIDRTFHDPIMPFFSPDGKRVLFLSVIDKYYRWHIVDLTDGKGQMLEEKIKNDHLRTKKHDNIPIPRSRDSVHFSDDGFIEYTSEGETIRINIDQPLVHRGV